MLKTITARRATDGAANEDAELFWLIPPMVVGD
jgi:hypothetical protein